MLLVCVTCTRNKGLTMHKEEVSFAVERIEQCETEDEACRDHVADLRDSSGELKTDARGKSRFGSKDRRVPSFDGSDPVRVDQGLIPDDPIDKSYSYTQCFKESQGSDESCPSEGVASPLKHKHRVTVNEPVVPCNQTISLRLVDNNGSPQACRVGGEQTDKWWWDKFCLRGVVELAPVNVSDLYHRPRLMAQSDGPCQREGSQTRERSPLTLCNQHNVSSIRSCSPEKSYAETSCGSYTCYNSNSDVSEIGVPQIVTDAFNFSCGSIVAVTETCGQPLQARQAFYKLSHCSTSDSSLSDTGRVSDSDVSSSSSPLSWDYTVFTDFSHSVDSGVVLTVPSGQSFKSNGPQSRLEWSVGEERAVAPGPDNGEVKNVIFNVGAESDDKNNVEISCDPEVDDAFHPNRTEAKWVGERSESGDDQIPKNVGHSQGDNKLNENSLDQSYGENNNICEMRQGQPLSKYEHAGSGTGPALTEPDHHLPETETNIADCDGDDVFSESGTVISSSPITVRPPCSPTSFALLFRLCRHEQEPESGQAETDYRNISRDLATLGDTELPSPVTNYIQPDFQNRFISQTDSQNASHMWTREVLCAERVSQMTKTYNDIEAVTRLLEEKERDLELAARIGQTLLSKNKELSSRQECLEEQLTSATDRVNQLRHELSMKDELLRVCSEDLERDDGLASPTPAGDKSSMDMVNIDFLEKKVKSLEDENLQLRVESANLQSATSSYEDKEKKLVEDCIQQLAEVNQQVETFASELQHKSEENQHQREEIKNYLAQIAGLQTKIRKLTLENMDMHEKLTASSESQRKLTKELGSMQDRYDELLETLEEAQEELLLTRSRHARGHSSGFEHGSPPPSDSLASELELSLQQEQQQQQAQEASLQRTQRWRVFETAKAAKKAAAKSVQLSGSMPRMSVSASPSSLQQGQGSDSGQGVSGRLSLTTNTSRGSDQESVVSDGYSADLDSLYESNSELGRPGIPGSNDLESALRRLATRRANELNEREFLAREREEMERRSRVHSEASELSIWTEDMGGGYMSGQRSPGGSSVSSVWSSAAGGMAGQGMRMSDKLQIVKPMEGSMTLRHWKNLANPHLGGLFEQREGIQMKADHKKEGSAAAAGPGETFCISGLEEEDEPQDIHTRKEQDSGLIYTFTNSTVRNPGPYTGLGALLDSSSSSQLGNFSNLSLTPDRLPVGVSTPVSSPATPKKTSSTSSQIYGAPTVTPRISAAPETPHVPKVTGSGQPFGLAALLQSPQGMPAVGRSLTRNNISRGVTTSNTNNSNSKASSGGPAVGHDLPSSHGAMSLSARATSSPVTEASVTSTVTTTTVSALLDANPPQWSSHISSVGARSMDNLTSLPPTLLGQPLLSSSSSSSSLFSSLMKQRGIPGSGSFDDSALSRGGDHFKTDKEEVAVSVSDPSTPRRQAIFTPGMTGQGLLQQLKSKGLSLYGLWGGASNSSETAEGKMNTSGTSIDKNTNSSV